MQRREVMLGAAVLWATGAWAQQPAPPGSGARPALGAASPAAAATITPAEYPRAGSTLRLVVPFAQGSIAEVVARLVEAPLARGLGLRAAVDLQPGQGGQAGVAAVVQAAPDGYTLLLVTLGHVAGARLPTGASTDFQRDLKPVALLASSPIVAVVPSASRIRTAADLLAAAKAGRPAAASGGNGTPAHLTLALYNDIAKTAIVHRPQPAGTGAADAVLAGKADLAFADLAEALPQLASGRLRALMIASVARHPRLPDVPTTAESGMPTLLVENWAGVMAPAKTPDLVIDKLDSELLKIMLSPEVEASAAAAGLRVDARAAGKFAAFLDAEVSRWTKLIGSAEIRAK